MTPSIKTPRKLIEVALPLDKINEAAAREKSIRHGHPSTLHLWWARRPLAAARAVIFASLVNDPGFCSGSGFRYGMNKQDAARERERLFALLEKLVLWENTTNEAVLEEAREEIRRSWREVCALNRDHPQAAELFDPHRLPGLHDPFAGGGTIPLEAQRLGLEAFASDLNPVAVLINKAMIEIPPRFAGKPPVHAASRRRPYDGAGAWPGASGLAEDVRAYGQWMRQEALGRIGHLYPPVLVTRGMVQDRPDLAPYEGKELTVIAWLWARTVKSPNPAFAHADVPLVSTFVLSRKEERGAWVEPVVEGDRYRFTVKVGKAPAEAEGGTKLARGANFKCLLSGAPMAGDYIKAEGRAGRMGARLMAVVAEGARGRVYLSPPPEHEAAAEGAHPEWKPEGHVPEKLTGGTCVPYGLSTWGDLFTPRQLVALTTFSDLVGEALEVVRRDALAAGLSDDPTPLRSGGSGALAYAEAVGVYLAFAIDRLAMTGNSLVRWNGVGEKAQHCFGRQALPMLWDFAEPNFFADATGSLSAAVFYCYDPLLCLSGMLSGKVVQEVAQTQRHSLNRIISTDPPYYDNIGYADLSDFFYVWLRRSLKGVYPDLFATLATPKAEELVATPYRHGGKAGAEAFFLEGMTQALGRLADQAHPAFPVTIYYAFKQSEHDGAGGTGSTGWETFLEAVRSAGFSLTGTWPVRTEMGTRQTAMDSNALASSIVLVCRKRPEDAPVVSRREFLRELNAVLPEALDEMTRGAPGSPSPVAPVDLSQAIIGPGMAVFSRYAAVLEADGTPMAVKTALELINRFLAEDDFDQDTQWCLHWFEQYGWGAGAFGAADVLARAKSISVEGLVRAGVVLSGEGRVRLRKWAEYPPDWNPATDGRLSVWEGLHQLVQAFSQKGEQGAGALLGPLRERGEAIRQLAYRLYTLCERSGRAEDARSYNDLVTAWSAIEAAVGAGAISDKQLRLSYPGEHPQGEERS